MSGEDDSDAGPHCDYCEECGQSICCDGHDESCPTQAPSLRIRYFPRGRYRGWMWVKTPDAFRLYELFTDAQRVALDQGETITLSDDQMDWCVRQGYMIDLPPRDSEQLTFG